MFPLVRNIQTRPTATLYEKKEHLDLIFFGFTVSSFLLLDSDLHVVVVPVGDYNGEVAALFGLIDSDLRTVVVDLGSYDGEVTCAFGLLDSDLRTVVIDIGSYDGEVTSVFSLLNSNLLTVVVPVWTDPTSPITSSYALLGSSLV